jgi:hypothetical protein
MERKITRYRVRRRSRISRAVGVLVALVLMITIAPIASAMSPVNEIDQGALASEDAGTGILLEDDIAEKLREILYREYNWRDQRSASVNPATASEQDVDDLFAHMEQNPALYSRATIVGIDAVADGSNTLDDYRSPVSSAATGRAIHPTMGEGYISGVLEPNHGAVRSGDRADTLDNLRAAPTSGNVGIDVVADGSNTLDDYRSPVRNAATGRAIHSPAGEGYFSGVVETDQGTAQSGGGAGTLDDLRAAPAPGNDASVTRAEDFQFVEQNVDFGSVNPGLAGPGEGLSDFQFIEQNTLSAKSTWYESIDE